MRQADFNDAITAISFFSLVLHSVLLSLFRRAAIDHTHRGSL